MYWVQAFGRIDFLYNHLRESYLLTLQDKETSVCVFIWWMSKCPEKVTSVGSKKYIYCLYGTRWNQLMHKSQQNNPDSLKSEVCSFWPCCGALQEHAVVYEQNKTKQKLV